MAVVNTSTFNFAEVLQRMLQDYGYDVLEEVFEGLDEVSKETVTKLRQESRSQFGNGDYAKGWTRTVERKRLSVYATIHGNKPTYQLAHLLEFSHPTGYAKRNGGRYEGRPHIAPVNDWAQDEAIDRIVSKLEKRL